jgi:uncharacterized protein DUF5681
LTLKIQFEFNASKQMPFKPGYSGNPAGKPRGCRNKTTIALEQLLHGEAETITRKAIELAKGGDLAAIRLCLDRLLPVRRGRYVSFCVPEIKTARDAAGFAGKLLATTACGELTPSEAAEIGKLVENFTRVLEASEIEQRLALLEQQINSKAS